MHSFAGGKDGTGDNVYFHIFCMFEVMRMYSFEAYKYARVVFVYKIIVEFII